MFGKKPLNVTKTYDGESERDSDVHKMGKQGYAVVSEALGCDARSYLKGYLSFVSMVNEVQALRLERLCPPGLFDM